MNPNPFRPANQLRAERRGLATLEAGQSYAKVRAVVREVAVKKNDRGEFLSLGIVDRTGEATAISWRGAALAKTLATGSVVEFERLEVDGWGPKFEPQSMRILGDGEFEPREFVASLPLEQIELNWRQWTTFLDSIENPYVQRLRQEVWREEAFAERYKHHPSAVHHHHNYLGGNVQHVVGIMRVVEAVCTGYRELDRDLALFGAAVHDLGKLREYAVGTTITVTDEGRLKGHLVIGAEMLAAAVARVRAAGDEFPVALEEHLVHMILAHHGKGEWGSPKPPATPEAMLLHLADMADSQTRGFLQDVERGQGSPDGWVRKFDADLGANRWIRTRRDGA